MTVDNESITPGSREPDDEGSEDANPELDIVVDFLRQCLPFSELDRKPLMAVARQIKITYRAAGATLTPDGGAKDLTIVRKGALQLQGEQGRLLDRLGEFDSVNLNALAEEQHNLQARVIEDALLYLLPEAPLQQLRQQHRQIDRFFHRQRDAHLRRAARPTGPQRQLLETIGSVIENNVIACPPQMTVTEAAKLMTEKRVSSLLVVEEGQLVGIVTDRDLRSRVVAQQLDFQTRVDAVMTANPIVLQSSATVFDAMLLMSERRIHHIPVVKSVVKDVVRDVVRDVVSSDSKDNTPLGVLSTSDLVRSRQRDPVFLVQKISREDTVEGLAEIAMELPGLVAGLVDEGARAEQVSHFLSVISDTFTRRLLVLGEHELGPPPARYAWLAFGSQGRREMALGGDQDNTLLFDDNCLAADRDYFAQLAQRVCDGLNACGYAYCKGGIMATNPEWRLPLCEWRETVSQWVRTPTDDAVMRVSIFFDLRCVHGDNALAAALQTHMLSTTSVNTIFLAALTRNALSNSAPLGFFRRFVLEHNGEHKHTFDIKRRGILPLVDMVRVHALAHGISAVNTVERLSALGEQKYLTLRDSRNLQDAFSFILQVRLRQQCQQLVAGQPVSNHINPQDLQDMEKRQLRDAFSLINEMQRALSMRFAGGRY